MIWPFARRSLSIARRLAPPPQINKELHLSATARRARLIVLAIGLIALIAPVSACGAKQEPLTKANFAQKVGAATKAKKSAHIESTIKTGVSEMSIEGDVGYQNDNTTAQIRLKQGQSSAGEMRLVDGHIYMSLPPIVPEGKFFEVTADNKALGSIIKMMDGVGPQQAVDQLEKGLVKVKYVGEKKIGDTKTAHYEITADPKKMTDNLGSLPKELVDQMKVMTYDVFLNPDFTMRRTFVKAAGSEITMNYSEWGKKISVQAPVKYELVPAPDFGSMR